MKLNKIYNEDCIEGMKELEDENINLERRKVLKERINILGWALR